MKYFLYSGLIKVIQLNPMADGVLFPVAWDAMLSYYNRWESRTFDNSYHMDSGSTKLPNQY